jgi:CRISPR/Cas system-associated exonuclease Cas4 (RecB family)
MREPEMMSPNNKKKTQKLEDIEWKSVESEIDDEEIRDEFSVLASRMDGETDFTHELWANSWDLLAKSSSQTTSH